MTTSSVNKFERPNSKSLLPEVFCKCNWTKCLLAPPIHFVFQVLQSLQSFQWILYVLSLWALSSSGCASCLCILAQRIERPSAKLPYRTRIRVNQKISHHLHINCCHSIIHPKPPDSRKPTIRSSRWFLAPHVQIELRVFVLQKYAHIQCLN